MLFRAGLDRTRLLVQIRRAVADLYSVVHREADPVSMFTTREEAQAEPEGVLEDEPG